MDEFYKTMNEIFNERLHEFAFSEEEIDEILYLFEEAYDEACMRKGE